MDDLQSWQGHNKLRAALVRSGFATANEVLACPSHSLQIRAKLSATEVDQCKALLSAWRLPDTSSVGSLAQLPAQLLSVGTEAIDRLLAGGLRPGTVTEIYGEASAGKSNFCLQLCLQVQLPVEQGGLHGSVLYLSSEGAFPVVRLRQMALARSLSQSVTNHVLLAQMGDFEDLEHAVRYTVPVLRNKRQSTSHPLRLLIIDSIAAPLRSEYASSSNALAQRGKDLSAFAYRLRSLAAELDLVLVVINQVSDSYDDQLQTPASLPVAEASDGPFRVVSDLRLPYTSQVPHFAQAARASCKHAALGLAWANMVDVRLALARTDKRKPLPGSEGMQAREEAALVRTASIVFSAFGPPASVQFAVVEEGIATPWDMQALDSGVGTLHASAGSQKIADVMDAAEEDMLWQGFEDVDAAQLAEIV